MNLISSKCCQECSKELRGRSDKKFCDDFCRSNFNNRMYAAKSTSIRNINHILRRNRQILAAFARDMGKAKVRGRILLERGFNPDYFTHTRATKAGAEFRFCYEFGYRFAEGDTCLIVGV
jgi:hypothetical protein